MIGKKMILDKINSDLLTARKAKEKDKITILQTLKGELGRSCDGKLESLGDDEMIKIIRKNLTNVEEVASYADDPSKFAVELELLNSYLPKMMSEDEVKNIVESAIEEVGAESMRDMGKVMAKLKEYSSVMDMKFASSVIKEKLS